MPKVTIEQLIDLHDNVLTYRFGKGQHKRPPAPTALCAFINATFPQLEAQLSPWGVTPYRQCGRGNRLIASTGQRREGQHLEVWPRGQPKTRETRLFSHKTAETYRTTWDIVEWIVRYHKSHNPNPPFLGDHHDSFPTPPSACTI